MERLKAAVVDSSVVLKWFRPQEPEAKRAIALREAFLDGRLELVLPDLAAYEVANVLRHRASEEIASRAVETLFDLKIPFHHLSHEVIDKALRAAYRFRLTVYDAIFLSVSELLGLKLITADESFYRALHRLPSVSLLSDLRI